MPKYKILTTGPAFYYETEKALITNAETGEPVVIKENILSKKERPKGKVLRILLGTKCNYNCTYCSQAFSREDGVSATLDDVDAFLKNASSWMTDIGRIEFWGGEPLVYIKYLKKLVPELRERMPDTWFTMVSNGSLLTDEIGDFLAKYRIFYTISHDSYAQKITRGADILDEPGKVDVIKRTFQKINAAEAAYRGVPEDSVFVCGFNLVFTKHCLNPIEAKAWLDKKMGMDCVISCDPVMGMGSGVGNETSGMTEAELRTLCANTFVAGMSQPGEYPYTIADDGMRFLRSLFDKAKPTDIGAHCGIPTGEAIVVDLKGNLYPCQNFVQRHHIRGNVLTDGLTKPEAHDCRQRNCCMHCPVVMLCHGGCPLAEGNGFVETCEAKFWYSLGLFATAFTRLTGYTPYRIEGNIVRPVKELITTKHGHEKKVYNIQIFSVA